MFHLIKLDDTTVESSVYSKDTVIPSDSLAFNRPSVGPAAVLSWVLPNGPSEDPSPSASCAKPCKVISPAKMPVSTPSHLTYIV